MTQLKITDPDDMANILNTKSGLLGISELSPDMRDLEKAQQNNHQAKLAIDIFINRIVKYIGYYVAEMGSVDVITFSAGIGENDIDLRQQIISKLSFINAEIDPKKNNIKAKERDITGSKSKVKILLIPTNEELMIAKDAYNIGYLGQE